MKGLTKQELETLMGAENIIFSYLGGEVKLMAEESKFDNDKAVETYVKNDIIVLINLYSEKVGE